MNDNILNSVNELFSEKRNIILKRPGDGISPLLYEKVLNRTIKKNLLDAPGRT